MHTVLITGARAPVALDLARCCAAAGHATWLGDSVTPFAAKWSSVGRQRVLRLPPARHAFADYGEALHRWVRSHLGALVMPTCEEVFYVAEAAARHGFADRVFAPPPAVLRRLHSKIDFPAWARNLGIAAPKTIAVETREDVQALAHEAGELVLKPEFSRFGTATLVRPGVAELTRVEATPTRRWAAQPFVAGDEICLWTAAVEGQIVASVAYRPRWRLGHSASFAFEAIDCPAALEVARAIAANARLTGHLSFDMILDTRGRAIPIECNPRVVSGLHLAGGRADLARALLNGGPPVHVTRGLAYLGPAMLLLGGPLALRRGLLGSWTADLRRGDDALARGGERGPAFGALVDAARFAWTGLSRRNSPTRQSTDDIEWNGEPIP